MIDHAAAQDFNLVVLGHAPDGDGTLVLLGPDGAGFWAGFTGSMEYQDGRANPLDRWSKRVIGDLAGRWNGAAIFPSDGPPYPAFLDWAKRSNRCWISPVGLMVHDVAGLWVSFRGAIRMSGALPANLPATSPAASPCASCPAQPCRDACPVGALSKERYDVEKCHQFLNTEPGASCLKRGCAARRACPISEKYGRVDAQSAFHMKAFHPV